MCYARGGAPRVLAWDDQLAHTAVTSVSLELRRSHHGHCSTYDAVRGRARPRARCGTGRSFQVASGASFSYLLPFALPAGRYVLDIFAADGAGNTTALRPRQLADRVLCPLAAPLRSLSRRSVSPHHRPRSPARPRRSPAARRPARGRARARRAPRRSCRAWSSASVAASSRRLDPSRRRRAR